VHKNIPRLAAPTDLSRVRAVVAAAYETYTTRMEKAPAPVYRDYTEAIDHELVWVTGDPIQGLISLVPAEDGLLIENIAVHPSSQGSGLGRRLMEFAGAQATAREIRRLTLYTNEAMPENVSIYRHLGFSEVDRRIEDGYRRIYMEKTVQNSN
jgi:ribosomal protein S18 acetylase RimI-like enzyme